MPVVCVADACHNITIVHVIILILLILELLDVQKEKQLIVNERNTTMARLQSVIAEFEKEKKEHFQLKVNNSYGPGPVNNRIQFI